MRGIFYKAVICGTVINLQYVTNNTYAPYVSTESDLVKVYDFRGNKFRRTKQHL